MENEEYIFSDETYENEICYEEMKILIVDDDIDVHTVTKLALEDFTFENKRMNILSVYSGKEAIELLKREKDIAVVLLDVVMEEEDSGLKVAEFLRNELQNKITRIILRTGQPGTVIEEKVTVKYDINDYKIKTELTAKKLFTTMIVALRNYKDLKTIDEMNKNLEALVEQRTAELKKTLEKLKNTQKEMIANEKITWIAKVLDEIYNEINGPFGAVLINLQMINKELELLNNENFNQSKKNINENIEMVETGIKKSYNSISKFMERNIFLNKKMEKTSDILDLKELILNTIEIINDEYQKETVNIKRDLDIQENVFIKGDEMKFIKAFYSIIENSMERLIEENSENEKFIKIRSMTESGKAVLEIEDNGIEITEEMKTKIYDPFYNTKEIKSEKLLELTKSYYMLKNYGAEIELENKKECMIFRIVFGM